MAGNPDKICVKSFRADWNQHIPIAALCQKYGITKDQLVRLKKVWRLKPRHDRRLRYRPSRRIVDPTPEEIKAACLEIRSRWDDETERERRGIKPRAFEVPVADAESLGMGDLPFRDGDE